MRIQNAFTSFGLLMVLLFLVLAAPAIARASGSDPKAEKPSAVAKISAPVPQPRQDQAKKVYTNDDFGWYSSRSSAVQSVQSTTVSSASSTAPGSDIELYDPHQDPRWYAQQVTALENDLQIIESRATALQQFRATSTGLPTGLDLSAPIQGITTDDFIAQLELNRQQIEQQLDDLADLARVNGLPPGAVNQPTESAPPAPTIEEQRDALTAEYRDAADQLAETQATLDAMQQQAAAQNITLLPSDPRDGGNLTTNLVNNLHSQQSALQNALSDTEDNARVLGIQPGDLR